MGFYTAMAAAGATLKAGGTYMESRAAADQREAQADISRHNAFVSQRDAAANDMVTRLRQVRQVEQGDRTVGSLRAGIGASGASLDSDASIRIIADQITENADRMAGRLWPGGIDRR